MTKNRKLILGVISVIALITLSFIETSKKIPQINPSPPKHQSAPLEMVKHISTSIHTAGAPTSIAPKNTIGSLSVAERRDFVKEIDQTFAVLMIAGVNSEQVNKSLSKLNERREPGVRALLEILSEVPTHDAEVRERISLVDYLLYRSRWDEETRAKTLQLAVTPIPPSVPSKFKAAMTVERAEIIGRMATIDWNSTSKGLRSIEHPSTRRVAAAEAVFALAQNGMPLSEARKRVKEVVPEYQVSR